MPGNFCYQYLNNISPVYEALARIGFNVYWIWKFICQIFDWLKLSIGFCFGILLVTCVLTILSDRLFLKFGDSLIQYEKYEYLLLLKMFMELFCSIIVSFASFCLILFVCVSDLEIHGPLLLFLCVCVCVCVCCFCLDLFSI